MRRTLILTLTALLVASAAAYGQAQRGTITVTVTANDGSRLPGATVEARSPDTLTRRTEVTDANGFAQLVSLEPATNYAVVVTLEGFSQARFEEVSVQAGSTSALNARLGLASVSETLVITGETPLVDVTKATAGQDITLQLTESIPTARTYQDYLQLVPSVLPTVGLSTDPASRSGLNYSDIGGTVGQSSDNFYYFEGIGVTDNVNGRNGANVNTEIIQEQSVLTGGLPAEFVGATGLVSNVITKSGGNSFSGSVNYYFQDDGLVADNENEPEAGFNTFDTAFTLGGPIVRDRAWFYTSFRVVEREEDVVSNDGNFLRTITEDNDQAFAKVTWAATESDLFSAIFLSDPLDRSGSRDNELTDARDLASERGGDRFTLDYSRVWSNLVLDIGLADHEADVNDIPAILEPRNDINFRASDDRSQADEQLGGQGTIFNETRGNQQQRASLEYLASSSWGDHNLKLGVELVENENFRNFLTVGDSSYDSLDIRYLGEGITAGQNAAEFTNVQFDPTNTSDTNGLRETIDGMDAARRQAFYALLDSDNNGFISNAELSSNIVFNETEGNPNGMINYDRFEQVLDGEQLTKSKGTTFYIQDQYQYKRFSANIGLRTEEWEHVNTRGEEIFTFEQEIAPRISLAYDLKGDGRQRLSAYFGRYYDPIRNNMTNFAGSVTGRVREEQVRICPASGCEWVTYRVRGPGDAAFAPTTQTPYTDEIQLGYKVDLGRNMSLEANWINRETQDILEDYDLDLYANPETYNNQFGAPGDVDITTHPDSLFLGTEYFGLDTFPDFNFIIGTLARGKREWDGVELIFRKRFSDNWQMLASLLHADGQGNTNSDSNADFQGDVIWLDPGAPNQFGTQPGLIEDLLKVAANYTWDNGFSAGGQYRWNSGAIVSRTWRASGRNLPCRVAQGSCDTSDQPFFEFAGITRNWIAPGTVGGFENESYGQLDLRFSYLWTLPGDFEADFFVDVFNVLDDQATTQAQDLVAGQAGVAFGEGLEFVDPQRFFLGARLRF